jgi:hypothetical protein
MDVGTIYKKLNSGSYRDPKESVEKDFELIFKNCFTYNSPGSPVYVMGRKAEALFEQKWQEMKANEEEELGIDEAAVASQIDADGELTKRQNDYMRLTCSDFFFAEKQIAKLKNSIANLTAQLAEAEDSKRRNQDLLLKERKRQEEVAAQKAAQKAAKAAQKAAQASSAKASSSKVHHNGNGGGAVASGGLKKKKSAKNWAQPPSHIMSKLTEKFETELDSPEVVQATGILQSLRPDLFVSPCL